MATRIQVPKPGAGPESAGPDLHLESTSFGPDGRIPIQHTSDGENVSPALLWDRPPKEARALALLCADPDAPGPEPFVHWLIADIDPAHSGTLLSQGTRWIPGAVFGRNSFGRLGYGGPKPPPGHGVHHYHFRLYALDVPLGLAEGFSKDDLVRAMSGHVLAAGELVGTYSR